MLAGNFAHDRQAQSVAIAATARWLVKALENFLAFGGCDPWPAIFDTQPACCFMLAAGNGDGAAVRRVA